MTWLKRKFNFVWIVLMLILLVGCDGFVSVNDTTGNETTTVVQTTNVPETSDNIQTTNVPETSDNMQTTEIPHTTQMDETTIISTTEEITTEADELLFYLNPGIDTIDVHTSFIDAGATAILNEQPIDVVTDLSTVNIDEIGEYYIKYSVVIDDETISIYRVVFVIDQTKPEVTLNPGIDTIHLNDEWIDAGVETIDHGDDSLDIIVEGEVDTSVAGNYIITYIVTDDSMNQTVVIRVVHVIE